MTEIPRFGAPLLLAVFLAVAAFSVSLAVDTALARCSVQHFSFKFGEQTSGSMTADSGEPCNIKLREGNGTIIKSLVTVARPANGSVTPQNSVNLTYRSRAGFRGGDNFVFGIVGTKNGVKGTARVSVSVSVEGDGNVTAPAASGRSMRRASLTRPTRQPSSPSGLRLKCLQQAGASLSPVTKRWTFYFTERDGASRTDMLRLCLAGGDREKAKRVAVPEISSR